MREGIKNLSSANMSANLLTPPPLCIFVISFTRAYELITYVLKCMIFYPGGKGGIKEVGQLKGKIGT